MDEQVKPTEGQVWERIKDGTRVNVVRVSMVWGRLDVGWQHVAPRRGFGDCYADAFVKRYKLVKDVR